MKTLACEEDRAELLARMASLRGSDRRHWGLMNVGEMVRHLGEEFREAGLTDFAGPPDAAENKRRALRDGAVWPMVVLAGAQAETDADGAEFALLKRELCDAMLAFVAGAGARLGHPGFGAMTGADWLRLGYVHADHHLRQFGR